MEQRTAANAPLKTDILVWVADIDWQTGKPYGWRMGKAYGGDGLPPELKGDGLNGYWNIPYWHPLPPDPKP